MSDENGIATNLNQAAGNSVFAIEIVMEWIDPEGEVSTTRNTWGPIAATNTMADIQGAVDLIAMKEMALSNAQCRCYTWARRAWVSQLKPPNPLSGIDNIEDKVYLQYETLAGGRISLSLPMPEALFLADGETVDPNNAPLLAFSTAAITGANAGAVTLYLCDATGLVPAAAYTKGYYKRAKTRRRLRQGISTEIGG